MREAGVFLRISTKFSSRKEVASGEERRRRPWGRRRRYRSKEKLMKIPVQITVRHMSLSEAAAAAIRDKAAKLDTFCDRIMSSRVLVEAPHRSQQHGMLYNVRIDLTLPCAELVVKRNLIKIFTWLSATLSMRRAVSCKALCAASAAR